MKKSLLLAAMLAVALSACGKKEEAKPAAAPAAPAAPAADAKPADGAFLLQLLPLQQLRLLPLQRLLLQRRSNFSADMKKALV